MPGFDTHYLIAIIIAVLILVVMGPGMAVVSGCVLVGFAFPDMIEKAKDYTHRKFFHSQKFLMILVVVFAVSTILFILSEYFKIKVLDWLYPGAIAGLTLGYISHLLADSTTYMGLPK